jgi:MFS family permease
MQQIAKKSILLSIISITICSVSFGILSPTTVILLEKNHSPTFIIGAVTAIGYACIFLFSTITGNLVARFGIRKMFNIGYLICVLGVIGLLFWRNYTILFIGRSLHGIGATLIFVTTEILINYCSTDENRGYNMNIYVIAFQVGLGVGTFLIWTVEVYEILPYLIGIFITLAALIVELVFFKNIKIELPKSEAGDKFSIKMMPAIAIIAAALYGYLESSSTVVIPLFGMRSGYSTIEVNFLVSAFATGGILILYVIGKYSDKIPKQNLLLIIPVILFFMFLGMVVYQSWILSMILFFMIGGLIPAFYTIGLTYVAEKVEMKFISQANGYFAMFFGLGTLLGPSLGSALISYDYKYSPWIFGFVICFVFILFFKKEIRKNN